MVLQLTSDQLQQLSNHAQQAYPEECCGLLLGYSRARLAASETIVVEVRQTANAWNAAVAEEMATLTTMQPSSQAGSAEAMQPTTASYYWIDPKEMLKAQREARDRGLDIVGIYHSHPDHPAIPSECDRQMAWSEYTYVILSVRQGEVREAYGWQLDEGKQFQSEEIVIKDSFLDSASQL